MNIDTTLLVPQTIPLPNQPHLPNPVPTIFGTYYTFQQKDVVLKRHEHTIDDEHITVVYKGSLTLQQWTTVDGVETLVEATIKAGDVINLDTTPHAFISLEDDCHILNFRKNNLKI